MKPRRHAITCALLALAASACGSTGTTKAASPTTKPAPITTTLPKIPYWCNAVGVGIPPSGHGNGSHVSKIYAGKKKGPLSTTDCAAMTVQWNAVIAATKNYGTRAKAEAAGWHAAADYVVGLGTHHTRGSIIPKIGDAQTPFRPDQPNFLIFGGTTGDAPLVGVAYTYIGQGVPPAGFAGGNDWWHEHPTVCIASANKILAGAEAIPDRDCTKLGGFNIHLTGKGGIFGEKNTFFMLHVWLPPYEYRPDVFVAGNPCLLPTGLAPKDNPCWKVLSRDPSLGLPPSAGGAHDMGHDTGHGA